jgi:hypothetical protein
MEEGKEEIEPPNSLVDWVYYLSYDDEKSLSIFKEAIEHGLEPNRVMSPVLLRPVVQNIESLQEFLGFDNDTMKLLRRYLEKHIVIWEEAWDSDERTFLEKYVNKPAPDGVDFVQYFISKEIVACGGVAIDWTSVSGFGRTKFPAFAISAARDSLTFKIEDNIQKGKPLWEGVTFSLLHSAFGAKCQENYSVANPLPEYFKTSIAEYLLTLSSLSHTSRS